LSHRLSKTSKPRLPELCLRFYLFSTSGPLIPASRAGYTAQRLAGCRPEARPSISTLISARNAGKRFGSVIALDSIDIEIARGQIVGIVGPSGAGKTTAIRLLLGLYKPTNGSVEVFGVQSGKFKRPERERIGYLPQQFLLYDDLTVYENLLFAAGLYGLGPRDRRARIARLLDQLQLGEARDRLARNISGGMQRRLALAATLIHQPELIVLDEPTAGLDPVLRDAVWRMFEALRQEGASLLVTTQYVTETERCDYIYLIYNGNVTASGTPQELRHQVFGGEVIRLKSEQLSPRLVEHLLRLEYVIGGRRTARDEIQLVVRAAHATMPLLTDEMRARGATIDEMEEVQISLDSVFVELVRQSSKARHDALSA
jgi:ABC-2 type transport system ATP-binding protein